jgi:hypothetical protein
VAYPHTTGYLFLNRSFSTLVIVKMIFAYSRAVELLWIGRVEQIATHFTVVVIIV